MVDVEADIFCMAEVQLLFDYMTLFAEFAPVEATFRDLRCVCTFRSKSPPFAMPIILHSVPRYLTPVPVSLVRDLVEVNCACSPRKQVVVHTLPAVVLLGVAKSLYHQRSTRLSLEERALA